MRLTKIRNNDYDFCLFFLAVNLTEHAVCAGVCCAAVLRGTGIEYPGSGDPGSASLAISSCGLHITLNVAIPRLVLLHSFYRVGYLLQIFLVSPVVLLSSMGINEYFGTIKPCKVKA